MARYVFDNRKNIDLVLAHQRRPLSWVEAPDEGMALKTAILWMYSYDMTRRFCEYQMTQGEQNVRKDEVAILGVDGYLKHAEEQAAHNGLVVVQVPEDEDFSFRNVPGPLKDTHAKKMRKELATKVEPFIDTYRERFGIKPASVKVDWDDLARKIMQESKSRLAKVISRV